MRIRLPTLKRSLKISDVVKTKQQISDVIDLMVSDTMELNENSSRYCL
jgi:hypothetical protein